MSKAINALGDVLGYNPYRDTEGKFDDGPQLLASRGRPKTESSENRRKIEEAKERLRKEYQIKDSKPEREKVLDGPEYLETAGFAINERNLASDHIRTTLWKDKELMPGQTYGEYYEQKKAKKGDIFMMTPAEYRQALVESGQYKDVESIERRMDMKKVDQYTEDMQSGDKFPPPALYYGEDGSTQQEGLHRVYAAERVGIEEIPVMVESDTRNQDIYPYTQLSDKILSQEDILNQPVDSAPNANGENGNAGEPPEDTTSPGIGSDDTDDDNDEVDGPAIEAIFYGISSLGSEHALLLEKKTDKSLTFSEEEAINAELKANEKNIKQETDKVLKDINNSDYDNAFLDSLSTTVEQEQAIALENKDEFYVAALDKIAIAIGDNMVDEDGQSTNDDTVINTSPAQEEEKQEVTPKFDSTGQLTGNSVVTEAEAKKATANSVYKETVYHGTVASAGQKIADEGFTTSTGEGQWFGDGVYLTPNAVDAFVYGNSKATPDDPTVVTSSYIDVATFFDDDTKYWDMVRQDMIDKGLIKTKTEDLKTFEQFEGFNISAREITQRLLSEYEGVKIPGDGETRDSYVIVSDPSKIKTYSVAEGQMAKQKYFDDIAKPKPKGGKNTKKANNQISSRDFPDLYKDIDIDTEDLGCIMLDLEPMKVMDYMKGHEDDLFENPKWDQGSIPAETVPHVTLLYGLLENGNVWKDKVDKLLKDWKLDSVKINKVGYFDTPDSYAIVAHLEKTPELIDGHERLTLLPHVNTFSEYLPHMTLAYVKKDADVDIWVKNLGKQYNGKRVKASNINYGDKPKDDKDTNSSRVRASLSQVGQEHNSISPTGLIIAYNALESETQDIIKSQENALKRGFQELERRIVSAATERVQKNYLEDASDLISKSEREAFVNDAQVLLNTFYINLYPLFGRQLMSHRASEYGVMGTYQMSYETQAYIAEMATKAAESHVNTVIQDLLVASSIVYAALVTASLFGLVYAAVKLGTVRVTKKLDKAGYKHTEDDVKKAVEAGIFDDTDFYKEAQRLARQGEGQAEIIRTIQNKYQDISKNRAATIARTESARVFNQSQFEADKQFLNDSGLMARAYKKLRNKAGDPCDHCQILINMPPIPFMKNFADLGTELKATVTKDDGTVKVKSLPINWEAVSAGNVHPNCRCEYVLIIKDN